MCEFDLATGTAHPTAEWIANQLTQAYGWEQAPRYLIRDRDSCCGSVFARHLRSLGICAHPTSARSSWQNGYAERLIGSIRRECLDHVVVFGERHLCHVLMCCMEYYNAARTNLSLDKDTPMHRAVQAVGHIQARPVLGGLHHTDLICHSTRRYPLPHVLATVVCLTSLRRRSS